MEPIVHKADFERVLAARSRARSAHFALHHLDARPLSRLWLAKGAAAEARHTDLSTDPAPTCPQAVDDLPAAAQGGLWFGCMVPKKHAKRAVTRNLLKRQMRNAFARLGSGLPAGLWLLRLKAPFDPRAFISAKSAQLAAAVRHELESLLAKALG